MNLDEFGFQDVSLIDGEHIESALDLTGRDGVTANPQVMLLTDRRVIHLHGNGKQRKAVFASIQDIDAVEIVVEKEGNGSFVWAAMAFIAAVFLYIVIDHSIGRVAGSLSVALMGVYLMADQVLSRGQPMVIFKAGLSQVQCDLKSDRASSEIYPFINRLFQLKGGSGPGKSHSGRPFALH